MSLRHVVIVSPHGLLREGLKRLLARVAEVELATSVREVEALARRQRVDAVIVGRADEQMPDSEMIAGLLSLAGTRVIVVSLQTGAMQVYQHEQVNEASIEELIEALGE
ncbi:MAG: hypothetical protein AB1801_04885 [Chloroflexota bacterium]